MDKKEQFVKIPIKDAIEMAKVLTASKKIIDNAVRENKKHLRLLNNEREGKLT